MRVVEMLPGIMLAAWSIFLVVEVSRRERRGLFSQGRIAGHRDLHALRAFIRRNMLASLLLLGTLTTSLVGSLLGFAFEIAALEWMALGLGALLLSSPFLVRAARTRRRIRGLVVAPELRREVRQLFCDWESRMVPVAIGPSVQQGAISVVSSGEAGSLALSTEKRSGVDLRRFERRWGRKDAMIALSSVLICGSVAHWVLDRQVVVCMTHHHLELDKAKREHHSESYVSPLPDRRRLPIDPGPRPRVSNGRLSEGAPADLTQLRGRSKRTRNRSGNPVVTALPSH